MCHEGVYWRERLCLPGKSCLGSVGFDLEVLPAEIGQFLSGVHLGQGDRKRSTAAPKMVWLPGVFPCGFRYLLHLRKASLFYCSSS